MRNTSFLLFASCILTRCYGFSVSRRSFFKQASISSSAMMIPSKPADAKEVLPATHKNVKEAFDDLNYELNGRDGSVARMQAKIDEKDFAGLLEITKYYDQEMRKGKVGKVKQFLPRAEREVTTISANAITFDLIGINKNCRAGKENASEANRYLDELRTDLQSIIDQKKNVIYVDLE
mmetsp:Transcript_14076/g.21505  ORF Transcript_14076/g.21505 Transcript_14076/m.21505 type:complete len:178 (+) Transcript_14076:141-674(+)